MSTIKGAIFDIVWVPVEGKEVQSISVEAVAAVVTPAISGSTYKAVVTVKDSRGAEATAEKNIVFA